MADKANKNKKYGRSKGSAANKAYKARNKKRSNKLRKLKAYCSANPNDKQASKAYDRVLKNTEWGYRK